MDEFSGLAFLIFNSQRHACVTLYKNLSSLSKMLQLLVFLAQFIKQYTKRKKARLRGLLFILLSWA